MAQSANDPLGEVLRRITVLEEYWTHLDRRVEVLDEVLRSVQDRLDKLEERVARWAETGQAADEDGGGI